MRVLITGINGFIAKQLSNKFDSFLGIDSDYTIESLYKLFNEYKPEVIFHIGACSDTLNTDINYMMYSNYTKTKWISDWCNKNNVKLIYSSSAAVYGIDGKKPTNLYGWSKLMGEDYVILNGGVSLRYFNVYGPGEEHKGRMASMIYQNINNSEVKLFPIKATRDFVYIDDVVDSNLYALKNYDNLIGNWYEVGTGNSVSFEKIFKILKIPYTYLDKSQIPKGYQTFTKSSKDNWMVGWKPKYDIEIGLKKYKKYLNEKS